MTECERCQRPRVREKENAREGEERTACFWPFVHVLLAGGCVLVLAPPSVGVSCLVLQIFTENTRATENTPLGHSRLTCFPRGNKWRAKESPGRALFRGARPSVHRFVGHRADERTRLLRSACDGGVQVVTDLSTIGRAGGDKMLTTIDEGVMKSASTSGHISVEHREVVPRRKEGMPS